MRTLNSTGPRPFWHRVLWKTGFSTDSGSGESDGLGVIQVHYIYCALYYYFISSISDHQELDPGVWRPRLHSDQTFLHILKYIFVYKTFSIFK